MAGVQGSALAAAVTNAGALGSLPAAFLDAQGLRAELLALERACGIGNGGSGVRRSPFPSYNVNFFAHRPPSRDLHREESWTARLLQHAGLPLPSPMTKLTTMPTTTTTTTTPVLRSFHAKVAAVLAEFRPRVVSFHFGLPSPELLSSVRAQQGGAVVMSTATTVEEARWLRDRGVDVIIAQGVEAGGHRGTFLPPDYSCSTDSASSDSNAAADGAFAFDDWASTVATQVGTFALLPQVVAAVAPTPVVAAGGIADAGGVAAAFALGASGVQVGTSFLLCDEATTSVVHRRALLRRGRRPHLQSPPSKASPSSLPPSLSSTPSSSSAAAPTIAHHDGAASPSSSYGDDDDEQLDATVTALTNVFTGRPARSIVNGAMRRLGLLNAAAPSFPLGTPAMLPLRRAAEARSSGEWSPLWAGQNVGGCREGPASEVVRRLMGVGVGGGGGVDEECSIAQ